MRILIACDGSEIGESAAAAVARWKSGDGAEVQLVTVIDPTDLHGVSRSHGASSLFIGPATAQGRVVPSPGRGISIPGHMGTLTPEFEPDSPSATPQAEDKTRAVERAEWEHFDYLRAVADCYFPGQEVAVAVEFSDDAAEAIREHAEKVHADVIAMGSHGRSGLSRALMGSVAEKVMRDAAVPVLIVGPAAREALGTTPGG